MFIKPKFLIRINYKSGISEEFWTWKLDYKANANGVTSLTWMWAGGNKPAIMNLDQIESVWHVKTVWRLFFGKVE